MDNERIKAIYEGVLTDQQMGQYYYEQSHVQSNVINVLGLIRMVDNKPISLFELISKACRTERILSDAEYQNIAKHIAELEWKGFIIALKDDQNHGFFGEKLGKSIYITITDEGFKLYKSFTLETIAASRHFAYENNQLSKNTKNLSKIAILIALGSFIISLLMLVIQCAKK